MVELLPEQKRKIERVISQISEEEGIGWWEARRLLHKFVCGGKCEYMISIVSMGRGGSGKTSFVALTTKYFMEIGHTSLL